MRLIGVNTPETKHPTKGQECYGIQASEYATSQLANTQVYLEYDPSQGRTDTYGRTLAYVWTTPATMFNYDLIANGYGYEYTYDNAYSHQDEFQVAQAQAQANAAGLGLWNVCAA